MNIYYTRALIVALPWHTWWAISSAGACWAFIRAGSAVQVHQGCVLVRTAWGKGDQLDLPPTVEERSTWVPCFATCFIFLKKEGWKSTKHPSQHLTQGRWLAPLASSIVQPVSLGTTSDSGNKKGQGWVTCQESREQKSQSLLNNQVLSVD